MFKRLKHHISFLVCISYPTVLVLFGFSWLISLRSSFCFLTFEIAFIKIEFAFDEKSFIGCLHIILEPLLNDFWIDIGILGIHRVILAYIAMAAIFFLLSSMMSLLELFPVIIYQILSSVLLLFYISWTRFYMISVFRK